MNNNDEKIIIIIFISESTSQKTFMANLNILLKFMICTVKVGFLKRGRTSRPVNFLIKTVKAIVIS